MPDGEMLDGDLTNLAGVVNAGCSPCPRQLSSRTIRLRSISHVLPVPILVQPNGIGLPGVKFLNAHFLDGTRIGTQVCHLLFPISRKVQRLNSFRLHRKSANAIYAERRPFDQR